MITIDIRKADKINDEYACFILFNYTPNIIQELRNYPIRYYHADIKSWELPLNKLNDFTSKFDSFGINLTGNTAAITKKTDIKLPEGFKFKTKPYSYQVDGVNYGLNHDKWFLGDSMGLGKSKQAIDISVARKIQYGYKHCLIVCGVNILKWNWKNEVSIHSDENSFILGERKKTNKWIIGSTKDKIKDLNTLNSNNAYFIITNIESFRDETISKTIKDLCDKDIINMCVLDEAHKIKNPSSQQSKGFLKCQPQCRIAMTGTPLMNSPLDLYVILKWLGSETHPFYSFKKYYCVMGGYGGYEVIGYRNMNQLTAQLNDIMLRRLKEDVLDLPDKTYIDEYVEMTPKQSEIYSEVEMDIKSNIDMIKFQNNPLSTLIRLRQATGYTGILSSTVQESSKLDRMEELVEEVVSNDDKCIIFSNWTTMTDIIYKKLKKYNPAIITGETKDNDRVIQQEKYMKDDSCKVIIGTIGACGTGLTLTAGSTVIFIDEPWSKALFEQAVDRAHRIGTKSNVTIYSLMCKDTIDCRIHEIIKKKGFLSDALVDGKVIGNKTEIFNYLLS